MTSPAKKQNIISSSLETAPLDYVYELVMGVKINEVLKETQPSTNVDGIDNFLISNSRSEKFSYPFISRGIRRYEFEFQNEFINYHKLLEVSEISDFFEYPKVVVCETADTRIHATFIENPAIIDHTSSVIVEKSEDFSLVFLLGLLNSKLFTYFILEHSPNENSNSYPILHFKLLQSLPIVICDPIDQEKIADLAYDLTNLKANYTAFKKSFISFIASKFNCTLNEMTLEEWPDLKFSEVVKELAKENIKLSSLEETEWKKYFNVEKEKAHELKNQINEIDQEIDEMVYELYELSDKEIKSVEDAVK